MAVPTFRGWVFQRTWPTRYRWVGSSVGRKDQKKVALKLDSQAFCFITTLTPAFVLSPSNREEAKEAKMDVN